MPREDAGKLLLRLAVGVLILLHGIAKIRFGVGDAGEAVVRHGLPHFVSYAVYVGEVVAPLFIIAGFWTRAAAAVLSLNMVAALVLGHAHELFRVEPHGGLFLEVQWLYLLASIAVMLLGAGRFSVGGTKGRWN